MGGCAAWSGHRAPDPPSPPKPIEDGGISRPLVFSLASGSSPVPLTLKRAWDAQMVQRRVQTKRRQAKSLTGTTDVK
eukprot:2662295-Rhodomonas_salina.2